MYKIIGFGVTLGQFVWFHNSCLLPAVWFWESLSTCLSPGFICWEIRMITLACGCFLGWNRQYVYSLVSPVPRNKKLSINCSTRTLSLPMCLASSLQSLPKNPPLSPAQSIMVPGPPFHSPSFPQHHHPPSQGILLTWCLTLLSAPQPPAACPICSPHCIRIRPFVSAGALLPQPCTPRRAQRELSLPASEDSWVVMETEVAEAPSLGSCPPRGAPNPSIFSWEQQWSSSF